MCIRDRYWDDWKRCVRNRDYPLGFHAGSFYGWARNWMGIENISVLFYDNPHLVHAVIDHLTDFLCTTLEKAVSEVSFDFALIFEDLGMKTGPLLSPDLFREFCLPGYRKFTAFLRSHGVETIFVDSDGNNDPIMPLWKEGGVNGMLPLEAAAGNNVVEMADRHGRDFAFMGNIDKRALRLTKKDVEKELMAKLPAMWEKGGYLPFLDHQIPPDIPLENFRYAVELIHRFTRL